MRVFRASDKMTAKEPMSLARAQGWDRSPSILPKGDTATQTKLRALAGQVNLSQIPLMQARIGVTRRREVPK